MPPAGPAQFKVDRAVRRSPRKLFSSKMRHFVVFLALLLGSHALDFGPTDPLDQFNLKSWKSHVGPFWQESRLFDREVEETERDREPLAPDYKDPTNKEAEKPKTTNAPFDPSVIPGGVIDVDAAGDFPSGFPNLHHNIFNPFNEKGGFFGGIGGFGGFFRPFLNANQPWWKGANVCIEREETTGEDENKNEETTTEDNRESMEEDDKKNETERITPNFFHTSISMSNCQQTPTKYECVTKINNHGVTKTFTVRYKCCYGFQRSEGSQGCTKQIELKNLFNTIDDLDSKDFKNMIIDAELENKCKNENLTIFIPTDDAMMDFNEKMSDMNKVEDQIEMDKKDMKATVSSKDLVLNHITKGFIDVNDVANEQLLLSENNNGTIRMNIYPTQNYERMITANCARVKKGNNLAENGIIHVIDGVIAPALQTIEEIINETPRLSHFSKLIKDTNFEDLSKEGHFTIFAPTNEAFDKLDENKKRKLLSGDSCSSRILRHHIVGHTVCAAAVSGKATTHNIEGELLNLERNDDNTITLEDNAKITMTDIIATNGVIHLIDAVIIPSSALHPNEALKAHNYTKFENLVNQAGLTEELDALKNVTLFVPVDSAFEDEDVIELLDEIKDDKQKLRETVMYHVIPNNVQSCDFNNNQKLETMNQGQSLRVNLYSTIPMFSEVLNRATINCARLMNFDESACGSTLHEVNKLLMPPTKSVLEIIKSNQNYSSLYKLMDGTNFEKTLETLETPYTFLAPDNDAFEKLPEKDKKSLFENKEKALKVLKYHVITEPLCCSGVGADSFGLNKFAETLSHELHQVSRSSGNHVRFGRASVKQCDILATNGIVHKIDKVLYPFGAQMPTGGLSFYLFNL